MKWLSLIAACGAWVLVGQAVTEAESGEYIAFLVFLAIANTYYGAIK